MLQTYLKKNNSFVGGTLTGFFFIFTIGIITKLVKNLNLMLALEALIFLVWFGALIFRKQPLKTNQQQWK